MFYVVIKNISIIQHPPTSGWRESRHELDLNYFYSRMCQSAEPQRSLISEIFFIVIKFCDCESLLLNSSVLSMANRVCQFCIYINIVW